MASPQSQAPFLAERVDIHKGCRSLESLINILNDYCEAAGAVVLLQKKLAKALREASGMKATTQIASNAMNASATIFEAMADIDSKFAKIADKEYDAISGEVKKWFKKLAKEEKAHDDRISNANAKIKQAGQLYEKKSKKNPRDSADEHARYITLISTLGPEISQEKHNHTLQVTERHLTTTYSVAACLSRIADAEWLRTCEGVRRFSPNIGPLGEWRALCEGGWTGAVPPSLVDPDADPQSPESAQDVPETLRNLDPPTYQRDQTPALTPLSSPKPQRTQLPPPSSFEPPRPLTDPISGSVRSLSAFPPPPTHFPIPSRPSQQASSSSSASHPTSNVNFPQTQPDSMMLEPDRASEEPISSPPSPYVEGRVPAQASLEVLQEELEIRRPVPVRSQTADSYQTEPSSGALSSQAYPRGDYFSDERESPKQPHVPEWVQAKPEVQRSDTGGSTGSVVAAMRNRYSVTSGSASPPPKDIAIPRLPLSVSDLATRYQPDSTPTSPQRATRAGSPVVARAQQQPASPERYPGSRSEPYGTSGGYSRPLPSPSASKLPDEALQRRNPPQGQFLDEAAEVEYLERERAAQQRERELGMRAEGMRRDSMDGGATSPKLRPRERKTSFRTTLLPRPQSQLETRSPPAEARSPQATSYIGNTHAHSYSATHLVPPPGSQTSERSGSPHAISCGCESCSVQHYKTPSNRAPSPHDLRPPEKPFVLRTEKPKGWMRRLSMPVAVGNAFSLDKKTSNPKMYSLDGGKRGANGSATALGTVDEQGRRRSYEANGLANRSMTSLVGGGRR
uniref:Uncharacterized protein n=1 Tax=Mycena chlorophos TaxID=658473 RepID=A0ABQ0MBL9_MYCCL|nr:predicted protein [Mycena chlorophos]